MLIAFEGPDGTGKTSICNKLRLTISQTSSCSVICNAYHNELGKFITMFVRQHRVRGITMMLLYLAYFAEIKSIILEETSKTNFVLLDRYYLSTYMYNCFVGNDEHAGIGKEIDKIIHHALSITVNDASRMLLLLAGITEKVHVDNVYFFKGHVEYALDMLDEYKKSYGISAEVSGDAFNIANVFRFTPNDSNTIIYFSAYGSLRSRISVLERILLALKLPEADLTVVFNNPIISDMPEISRFDEICAYYKNTEILRNLLGNNFIQHDNAKTFIEQVKRFSC